ncbi:unnamed protein product, partial [marine sediment metagenome]
MASVKQNFIVNIITKGHKLALDVSNKIKENLSGAGANTAKTTQAFGKTTDAMANHAKKAKGVANATTNSTKAFSKMEQGMVGGLVPAYATVAANVFAT